MGRTGWKERGYEGMDQMDGWNREGQNGEQWKGMDGMEWNGQ